MRWLPSLLIVLAASLATHAWQRLNAPLSANAVSPARRAESQREARARALADAERRRTASTRLVWSLVDQHDRPITNAEVQLRIGAVSQPDRRSDARGRFRLDARADTTATVLGIRAPGYDFSVARRALAFHVLWDRDLRRPVSQCNEQTPCRLVGWKWPDGPPDHAMEAGFASVSLSASVTRETLPLNGTGDPEAPRLAIELERVGPPRDWRLRITAPQGGGLQSADPWLARPAPLSGYTRSLVQPLRGEGQLYLRLAATPGVRAQRFARLRVSSHYVCVYRGHSRRVIEVTYHLNTSGARELTVP